MNSKTNQTLEKFNFIPEFMKFDIKRKSELITNIFNYDYFCFPN